MYENHPYLTEIKSHALDIPQRLKEIDPSLFLVYNAHKQRVEVHSTANKGGTYFMTAPYLDSRLITDVQHNNYRRQQGLLKILEQEERDWEKKMEKEKKTWIEDVTRETRWHWSKTKEELGL